MKDRLSNVVFDVRTKNKHIYELLGWSKDKFYTVCRGYPNFSDLLKVKRRQARIEKLVKCTTELDYIAFKLHNLHAVIYILRSMGYGDVDQTVQEEEPEKDPNSLTVNDFTDAELLKMKKCRDAARKRKAKKCK